MLKIGQVKKFKNKEQYFFGILKNMSFKNTDNLGNTRGGCTLRTCIQSVTLFLPRLHKF